MGDPVAAARHPVGQVYYSFSTFLRGPHAASEGAGDALGAQASEAGIRFVVRTAGFRTFRRVAETPFNLVYEPRP